MTKHNYYIKEFEVVSPDDEIVVVSSYKNKDKDEADLSITDYINLIIAKDVRSSKLVQGTGGIGSMHLEAKRD